jgi:hypothetical protein
MYGGAALFADLDVWVQTARQSFKLYSSSATEKTFSNSSGTFGFAGTG